MRELQERNALHTGASGGLGCHIALALTDAGVNLVLAGRNRPKLERRARELRDPGVRIAAVERDLTAPGGCEALVDEARRRLGPIQILVNNAGIEIAASYTSLSPDELERIDMLAAGEGHVVNISSIGGKGGTVGFSVVCPGFVLGEGMSGRRRARGLKPPAVFGTTTPHAVGEVGEKVAAQSGITDYARAAAGLNGRLE